MPDPFSISPHPSPEPSLNYHLLLAEGIAHLQQLSGEVWTDHNSHDPGITLLEAVCYSLTELGYHTSQALTELGQGASGSPQLPDPAERAELEQLLSSNPVTGKDFRRLLLDFPAMAFEPLCSGIQTKSHGNRPAVHPTDSGISHSGREADAMVITGSPSNPGPQPFWVRFPERHFSLLHSEFSDENGSHIVGLNDCWIAPGPAPVRSVYVEFTDPDLNHFIHLHQTKDDGWAIAATGHESRVMHIVRPHAPKGEEPFIVRHSDHEMELALPGWTELQDTPWMSLTAILDGVDVGYVKAGETTCRITGWFTDAHDGSTLLSDLLVATRSVSPAPPATDLKTAIRHIVRNEADRGLFEFFHQKMKRLTSLREAIARHLQQHRNLGEFFCATHIFPLQVSELAIKAKVIIDDHATQKSVTDQLAEIIDKKYRPRLVRITPEDKIAAGILLPDAFEGYVPEQSLEDFNAARRAIPPGPQKSPRPTTLCASDVLQMLMSIEGVRSVDLQQLTLYHPGSGIDGIEFYNFNNGKDTIVPLSQLSANGSPEPRARMSLSGHKSRRQFVFQWVEPDEDDHSSLPVRPVLPAQADPAAPSGRIKAPLNWKLLGQYFSLQHDLPPIYGLQIAEPEIKHLDERRQHAWQLRGFLTFFDQILANAHAQVAFTPKMFLAGTADAAVRPVQELDSVLGLPQLLMDHHSLGDLANADTTSVETRAAKLVDHLLARQGQTTLLKETALKKALLEDLPNQNRSRGAAGHTSNPSSEFSCSLHRRVCHLLNEPAGNLFMVEAFALKLAIASPAQPQPEGGGPPAPNQEDFTLIVILKAQSQNRGLALKTQNILYRESPAHLCLDIRWAKEAAFGACKKAFDQWRKTSDAAAAMALQSRIAAIPKPGHAP